MMRAALLFLALALAACGAPEPPLVATDVEITKPVPGRAMSAGFLVLHNSTDQAIRITGATSPQFGSVEIHETRLEDGISRMRKLDVLVVPPHGSVTLERGGKHLMLMRARDLDDSVTLNLVSDGVPVLTIDYRFEQESRR